jgi:serine/threonine protein kinase
VGEEHDDDARVLSDDSIISSPLKTAKDTKDSRKPTKSGVKVLVASNSLCTSLTRTASACSFSKEINEGDQRYMAPEMLRETYENLATADIFSLGASLYEMVLHRELPGNGPEWHEIRRGMLDPDALKVYTPSMQYLVRLMLQPDPALRPSAEALIASGGPDGILRTESEAKLAREKAAADDYRKQLARLRNDATTTRKCTNEEFDLNLRYRIRRSNTI